MKRLGQLKSRVEIFLVGVISSSEVREVMKIIAKYLVAVIDVSARVQYVVVPNFVDFEHWWNNWKFIKVFFVQE